ncbi:hypothetical protein V5O48_005942 [Marasmius crinis-equi]|uniref:Uncharacterized protein n=1 Tax=Marasmius crinis-equi TaxID=585013 RepID=A0ABR3FKY0_9AGAR
MPIKSKNTLRGPSVTLQRVCRGFFILSYLSASVVDVPAAAVPPAPSLERLLDEYQDYHTSVPISEAEPILSQPISVIATSLTETIEQLPQKATTILKPAEVTSLPLSLTRDIGISITPLFLSTTLPPPLSSNTGTHSVSTEVPVTVSLPTPSTVPHTLSEQPSPTSTTLTPPVSRSSTSLTTTSKRKAPTPTGFGLQATRSDMGHPSVVSSDSLPVTVTSTPSLLPDPVSDSKSYVSNHRELFVFGAIILILFLFVITSFVIARTRHINWFCNRRKRIDYGLDKCIEKDLEKAEAWMQSPSQNSIAPLVDRELLSPQPHRALPDRELARLQNKVIDIVTDFPRSRFSVTSSDLGSINEAFQIGEAEDSEDEFEDPCIARWDAAPLLSPAEFFSLPSTSTISSRHSRRNSAPVFGRHRRVAGLSVASYRSSRAKSLRLKSGTAISHAHRKSRSVPCVVGDGQWI